MFYVTLYNNLLQMEDDQLKKILLKRVPPECYDKILEVQAEERIRTKKQYSLESAVYKIIKSTIKKENNNS